MADFRFRRQAERWFNHIVGKPPLKTKFDLYYLCAMLGLAARRSTDPTDGDEAPGFVDHFVKDYETQELLVVGLLLRAEIERLGYDLSDRDEVRQLLGNIMGPHGLSAKGIAKLDEYASGGFDILQERRGAIQPYSAEEFLPNYVELLNEAGASEPLWRKQ